MLIGREAGNKWGVHVTDGVAVGYNDFLCYQQEFQIVTMLHLFRFVSVNSA